MRIVALRVCACSVISRSLIGTLDRTGTVDGCEPIGARRDEAEGDLAGAIAFHAHLDLMASASHEVDDPGEHFGPFEVELFKLHSINGGSVLRDA